MSESFVSHKGDRRNLFGDRSADRPIGPDALEEATGRSRR